LIEKENTASKKAGCAANQLNKKTIEQYRSHTMFVWMKSAANVWRDSVRNAVTPKENLHNEEVTHTNSQHQIKLHPKLRQQRFITTPRPNYTQQFNPKEVHGNIFVNYIGNFRFGQYRDSDIWTRNT
jgi:hypothetical protein